MNRTSNYQHIKKLIQALDLSVLQFEKKIGVKQSRIDKALKRNNGLGPVSLDIIQMILTAYPQVSMEYLKTGEGEMFLPEGQVNENLPYFIKGKSTEQTQALTAQGLRFKQLRTDLGYTDTSAFAEAISGAMGSTYNPTILDRIEAGEADIPGGLLATLTTEFDVEINWILTGEGPMLKSLTKQPVPAEPLHDSPPNAEQNEQEGMIDRLTKATLNATEASRISAAAAHELALSTNRALSMLEKAQDALINKPTGGADHNKLQDVEVTLAALWQVFSETLAPLTDREVDSVYRSVGIRAAELSKRPTFEEHSIQSR